MSIDERTLGELIVESQDLQADALRDMKGSLSELREIGHQRRNRPVDPASIRRYNASRRDMLKKTGFGLGGLSLRGLFAGAFGTALAGIVAGPAHADTDLDIQILQTAASLEILAVATYEAALTLPFIKDGNATVVAFAQTTMKQHNEHKMAFQAQTEALGGTAQTAANPKYVPVVEAAKPTLKSPIDVVKLAATLEEVATDTYLANLSLLEDTKSKEIFASVMGVETQHLATLRAVGALLEGGGGDLIRIPTDVAKLPAAAGSVAFPEAQEEPDKASPPKEGAVK